MDIDTLRGLSACPLFKGLTDEELMDAMHEYLDFHEAHRDGKNCARILDAVDDFIANRQHSLRRKPLNLFRKLKIRWKFFKDQHS